MAANNSAINVLIIDDETEACENLKNILTDYVDADVNIIGVAHDTIEAEKLIRELKPDGVFLDIQMTGENAFQLLERIHPVEFEVVFVTAYDDFAIKAFKLNAVDYILKPIDIDDLIEAVAKLRTRILYRRITQSDLPLSALQQITNKEQPQKITLKCLNRVEIVDFKDIYYLENQGSYCRISFNKNGINKEFIASNVIAHFEDILPPGMFFRIHRSYLVNCTQIDEIIADDSYMISLKNKEKIPVSRRRYHDFINFLKEIKL